MKIFRVLGLENYLELEGSKLVIPTGNSCHGILLICEARSIQSLDLLIQKQLEFLSNNSINFVSSNLNAFVDYENRHTNAVCSEENGDHIPNYAYTYRAAFIGSDVMTIYKQLVKYSPRSKSTVFQNGPRLHSKVAMLFTGQCSQYAGMGLELYQTSSAFRTAFDCASTILRDEYDIHINDVVYGNQGHLLDTSLYSQTSIFCLEVGLIALWRSYGVEPVFVLGPSAGGFAAGVAAGVLTLGCATRLVGGRARLINYLPEGGMTAVQMTEPEVRGIINEVMATKNSDDVWLDIAVINSDNDVVVAGTPKALTLLEILCENKSVKTCRLKAKQAFHSRQIDCILKEYENIIENTVAKTDVEQGSSCCSSCKYISGIDGTVMDRKDFKTAYWMSHAREMVNLPVAINTLWDHGVRIFIELGPRPVLLNDAQAILGGDKTTRSLWLPSINKPGVGGKTRNWTTVLEGLGQLYEAEIIDLEEMK